MSSEKKMMRKAGFHFLDSLQEEDALPWIFVVAFPVLVWYRLTQ
jgi:hypothetical protein